MFESKKTLKRIIDEVMKINKSLTEENIQLKKSLENANNLKSILEKLSDKNITSCYNQCSTTGSFDIFKNLPDTVAVYVDDILGGKVIKQEGKKCIIIEKDGKVKEGLTKQDIDEGYTYKLIRQ